ncbi:uncharacterized protein J4E78_001822 [Alternaria triticimaculans]|uniref:uncharacterized protein n=1 Tax=Alternaria triticimaculans TaxID=297637 RepID=UPI0020C3AD32|nr:uncharacterized protein J4E78_001822 [Alternaria triticimaculans]KAI4668001.1 hypothetical protein J4E78_001822 [Alternaria triticimaculans]
MVLLPFHVRAITNSATRLLHREGGPIFLAYATTNYMLIKHYLPREVRDMIWAQVWDEHTVEESLVYMRNTINSTCRLCLNTNNLNCPYHLCLPFFVRPELVGSEMATELVESWYNIAATKHHKLLYAWTAKGVQEIICKDAFNIGREPAQFIRKLEISMNVDDFVPPEPGKEGWGDIRSVEHRRELITEPLLKIQNKSGFRFKIEVCHSHIRLNLWKEVFDTFREPVRVMKDEGAIVKATFIYKGGYNRSDDVATYDILDAMTQPEEEWKANAVAFFDARRRIPDEHRLYRDEDRPNFNPESQAYLTQKELEDRHESYMDSLNYSGTDDGPPPHDYLREYMETGTLKHEEGVCQCPDCNTALGDHLRRARYHYSSDDDDEHGGHIGYIGNTYYHYDDDDEEDEEDDEESDEGDDNGSDGNAGSDGEEMDDVQGGQQSDASHQT